MSWLLNTIVALTERDEEGEEEEEEEQGAEEQDHEDVSYVKYETGVPTQGQGKRLGKGGEGALLAVAGEEKLKESGGAVRGRDAAESSHAGGGDGEHWDAEEGVEADEAEAAVGQRPHPLPGSRLEGVSLRDDLTELQRSLRSGFRGMASFLAGEAPAPTPAGERDGRVGAAAAAKEEVTEEGEDGTSGAPVLSAELLGDGQLRVPPTLAPAMAAPAQKGLTEAPESQEDSGLPAVGPPDGGTIGRTEGASVEWDPAPAPVAGVAGEGGEEKEKVVKGIQDDLAELSSRFKVGLSQFSSVIRAVRGDDLVVEPRQGRAKSRAGQDGAGNDNKGNVQGEELALLPAQGTRREGEGAEGAAAEEEEETEEGGEEEEEEGGPSLGAAAAEALLRAAQEDMKALSGTLASGISGFSSLATRFLSAAGAEWEEDEEGEEEGGGGGGGGAGAVQGADDKEEQTAVGITEDVLSFAHNISLHPETWIDFPLPDEDDEPEDFCPTRAQEQHMEALEMRVPRLVAVRLELTPAYISEQRFWKIYFVLLHSHLPPAASAVLSTPAVLAARARVVRQLQQAEQQQQPGQSLGGSGQASALVGTPGTVAGSKATAAPAGATPALEPAPASGTHALPVPAHATAAAAGSAAAAQGSDPPLPNPPKAQVPLKDNELATALVTTTKAEGETKEEAEADDWLNEEEGANGSGQVEGDAGGEDDEEVSFSDLEEEEGDEGEGETEGGHGKWEVDHEAKSLKQSGPASSANPVPPSAPVNKAMPGASPVQQAVLGAVDSKRAPKAADWEVVKTGQDGNSSGGSDNHSADWQTVDSDDLA